VIGLFSPNAFASTECISRDEKDESLIYNEIRKEMNLVNHSEWRPLVSEIN